MHNERCLGVWRIVDASKQDSLDERKAASPRAEGLPA